PALLTRLKQNGVLSHGTLVVGMPGETEADINVGFDYVRSLELNSINVFIAQPIPGSELFEIEIDRGRITYQQGFSIDTSRATRATSAIDPTRLEQLTAEFLHDYNEMIYRRDPASWERK